MTDILYMKLQITIDLYDSDDSENKNVFEDSEKKIIVKRKRKQTGIIKHIDTKKKLDNKIEIVIPLHKNNINSDGY